MWRLSIIIISFCLFVGCGFKGPLYMPPAKEKPAVVKKTSTNTSKPISSSPQSKITSESGNQMLKLPQ